MAAGFLGGMVAGLGVISAVRAPIAEPAPPAPITHTPARQHTLHVPVRVRRQSLSAAAGPAALRAALFGSGASLSADRPSWRKGPASTPAAQGEPPTTSEDTEQPPHGT